MKNYIVGFITFSNDKYVEIECGNVGYKYSVVRKIDLFVEKLFLYEMKNEFSNTTYAFYSEFDRNTFISLLSIKGVGVAIIRNLYRRYDTDQIREIVQNKDINKLLIVEGIGQVTARNIVGTVDTKNDTYLEKEIIATLRSFGYTSENIRLALKYIDNNQSAHDNITNIIKKL